MLFSFWNVPRWTYSWFAWAALCGTFSLSAHAQGPGSIRLDPTPTLEASQASTAVPALNYRSVFAELPQGVEATVLDWKAANAQVGQFRRGHADLLKWELEQARKPAQPQPGGQP